MPRVFLYPNKQPKNNIFTLKKKINDECVSYELQHNSGSKFNTHGSTAYILGAVTLKSNTLYFATTLKNKWIKMECQPKLKILYYDIVKTTVIIVIFYKYGLVLYFAMPSF